MGIQKLVHAHLVTWHVLYVQDRLIPNVRLAHLLITSLNPHLHVPKLVQVINLI